VCKVQSNSCVADSCYNVVISSSECGSSCEAKAITYQGYTVYICKSESALNYIFCVFYKFFYRFLDDCLYTYANSTCPSSCRNFTFEEYYLLIIVIYNAFYYLG
jgi:hypothetical protein